MIPIPFYLDYISAHNKFWTGEFISTTTDLATKKYYEYYHDYWLHELKLIFDAIYSHHTKPGFMEDMIRVSGDKDCINKLQRLHNFYKSITPVM